VSSAITLPQQAGDAFSPGRFGDGGGRRCQGAPRPVKVGGTASQWVIMDGLPKRRPGDGRWFSEAARDAPVKAVPWLAPGSVHPLPPVRLRPDPPASASATASRCALRSAFMAKFFIDPAIFAWVIALFIIVMGRWPSPSCPLPRPPVATAFDRDLGHLPGASAKRLKKACCRSSSRK